MKIYLKYGLLNALASILWMLLSYVLGLDAMEKGDMIKFASIVIPITCIYLGIKEKRDKENQGFISYAKAFNLGLAITAVGTIVSTIFFYFHVSFINPGMIEFAKSKQLQQLQERGMSDQEIEQALSISDRFMTPVMFTFFGLLASFIIGLILSLIIAAVLKKEDPQEIS